MRDHSSERPEEDAALPRLAEALGAGADSSPPLLKADRRRRAGDR